MPGKKKPTKSKKAQVVTEAAKQKQKQDELEEMEVVERPRTPTGLESSEEEEVAQRDELEATQGSQQDTVIMYH